MTTHSADATTPALEVPTLARRHGVAVSVVTLALLMTLAIPSVRNKTAAKDNRAGIAVAIFMIRFSDCVRMDATRKFAVIRRYNMSDSRVPQ